MSRLNQKFELTKLKGIINQEGKLIIEEKINLNAGEVEVVILPVDDLTNIETQIKLTENKGTNQTHQPIYEGEKLSVKDYTLEELLEGEMENSEEINWGKPEGEEIW